MALGDKLISLRKKSGLSQEEVAEKLGVSRQTISKWETNQTVPELIKAKLLSQLYNVSYDYLIISKRNPVGFRLKLLPFVCFWCFWMQNILLQWYCFVTSQIH